MEYKKWLNNDYAGEKKQIFSEIKKMIDPEKKYKSTEVFLAKK